MKNNFKQNIMPKNKFHQWTQVNTLPDSALTVTQYANKINVTPPYIYWMLKHGKNFDFEIVDFKGRNYIIPK
jgi:hypothetical protein